MLWTPLVLNLKRMLFVYWRHWGLSPCAALRSISVLLWWLCSKRQSCECLQMSFTQPPWCMWHGNINPLACIGSQRIGRGVKLLSLSHAHSLSLSVFLCKYLIYLRFETSKGVFSFCCFCFCFCAPFRLFHPYLWLLLASFIFCTIPHLSLLMCSVWSRGLEETEYDLEQDLFRYRNRKEWRRSTIRYTTTRSLFLILLALLLLLLILLPPQHIKLYNSNTNTTTTNNNNNNMLYQQQCISIQHYIYFSTVLDVRRGAVIPTNATIKWTCWIW